MSQNQRIISIFVALCMVFAMLPMQALAEDPVIANGTCGEDASWFLTESGALTIFGTGKMDSCQDTNCPWLSYRNDIKKVVIENGITMIGQCAFQLCKNLEDIEIANSVTIIGHDAFLGCYALKSIILPDNVSSISLNCFYACRSIESIIIPKNIKKIEQYAFSGCNNLKEVYFKGNAPVFGKQVFGNVTATAYYPLNNETWTEAARQSYGGQITWIPYGDEGGGEEISITVNALVGSVSTPEGGWKEGTNTFTVAAEKPCVVAVSYDSGATYTRLTAVATGTDNTYSFTANDMTESSIVAVIMTGDANGDGAITNADVTRLKAAYQNKVQLDSLKWLAADVNNSGDITNADVTRLKAVYQNKTSFSW